jgi:hypothetical protein
VFEIYRYRKLGKVRVGRGGRGRFVVLVEELFSRKPINQCIQSLYSKSFYNLTSTVLSGLQNWCLLLFIMVSSDHVMLSDDMSSITLFSNNITDYSQRHDNVNR